MEWASLSVGHGTLVNPGEVADSQGIALVFELFKYRLRLGDSAFVFANVGSSLIFARTQFDGGGPLDGVDLTTTAKIQFAALGYGRTFGAFSGLELALGLASGSYETTADLFTSPTATTQGQGFYASLAFLHRLDWRTVRSGLSLSRIWLDGDQNDTYDARTFFFGAGF